MNPLHGSPSDVALPGGLAQRISRARFLWRRLHLAWKSPRKIQTGDQAWATALPHVLAMDAHILRDIGAPAWVVSQAQQRQASLSRRPQEVWRR